jgi:hypothetical protein
MIRLHRAVHRTRTRREYGAVYGTRQPYHRGHWSGGCTAVFVRFMYGRPLPAGEGTTRYEEPMTFELVRDIVTSDSRSLEADAHFGYFVAQHRHRKTLEPQG